MLFIKYSTSNIILCLPIEMSIVNLKIIFNLWKIKSRHANAQLKAGARHSFITEMAVSTLETDYSCETSYPFDDSRR